MRSAAIRVPAVPLLRAQLLWTLAVAAAWVGALLALPIDPDYTAGELLDHVRSWQAGDALYRDPSAAPYRVLNYPPTVLALVRALAALGVDPLLAGRLLGTLGVALALVELYRWLRADGADHVVALGVASLAGASFPLLYAAGQFHLEGLAAAATLAGFRLVQRPDRRNLLLAGALLALACLVKQTQAPLSLVALAYVLRTHGRTGWPAVAAYSAVGTAGCAAITLAFGPEAWRHLVAYTVGTYSAAGLARQLASHALPWAILAAFAYRAALRQPGRSRDARVWYLAGATLWLASAARLGASYPYFVDWQLAVLLWIGPVVQSWRDGGVGWAQGPRARMSVLLFAAQVVIADLAVAGTLAWVLAATRRTAHALPVLCRSVPVAPALTPAEEAGVVRACGGRPALHPFIVANLAERGLWDERPFVADLRAGRYPVLLLPFDPAGDLGTAQRERWTPAMVAAIAHGYRVRERVAGWRVLVPAPAAAAP